MVRPLVEALAVRIDRDDVGVETPMPTRPLMSANLITPALPLPAAPGLKTRLPPLPADPPLPPLPAVRVMSPPLPPEPPEIPLPPLPVVRVVVAVAEDGIWNMAVPASVRTLKTLPVNDPPGTSLMKSPAVMVEDEAVSQFSVVTVEEAVISPVSRI